MSHVSFDKMSSSKGTAQRQLTGEDSRGNDSGQALGVLSGGGWVRSTDAK